MVRSGQAVHRTIVVVDVAGFGDPRRTLPHQLGTRTGLYRVVADALAAADVPWGSCYHEDRGDGLFVLVPPEYAKAPLVEVVPVALARALRDHNDAGPPEQRVRLRVAVHAGEVAFDDHGVTSTALTTAFRLLDAPALKKALGDSPGLVALIVSRWVFEEVVRHSAVLDPGTFRAAQVEVKEVRDTAWIALPDHPYPVESTSPTTNNTGAPPATAIGAPLAATATAAGAIAPPAIAPSAAAPSATASPPTPPRQLPAAPAPFVGREDELSTLDQALTGTNSAIFISAIGGAGGIGKTWLALHWAHRHADRFPDGQLFVDLRGFSPDSGPLAPTTALRNFLHALGVDRIPTTPDAQAALYRSTVAGKRLLVVLDNAATADQVVPLLPGTPTCTVLITGRRRLAALVDRYAARHLRLGTPTPAEARALLAGRLGAERVDAEPDAVDELVELCGCYPLALAVAARHAATRPIAELVAELREPGLDVLDDDPSTSLPAVLSLSLRDLTADQRTAFALLAIAPGPDTGLPAAAALTGTSPARTRRTLRALEDACLVDRHANGRHAMHDLVRAYAATLADELPEPVRHAALDRVVDFYLHTAHAAARVLEPQRRPIELAPPTPGTTPLPLPADPDALAWLDAEHAHVLAAQRVAAARHRHHAAWQFAWALTTFHDRRGHRHAELAAWRAALAATDHLPDPTTRARTHRHLGTAHADLGRHEEAIRHLHHALALAEEHDDTTQQAHTHQDLAVAHERQGDDRRALVHAERALDHYRTLDEPLWEANALNQVGWYAARLGDHDTARDRCLAALALFRRHHHAVGEAHTLDSLGYVEHRTGHHERAVGHYRHALALFRDLGISTAIADTLDNIGHPHLALGRPDLARAAWREAGELYREQGRDRDTERVRRQLDDLNR
ncbi:ATP-binding protein [Saccharothrix syringae]|uniref:Tetratricopeptide repeat protein n=1 Tax=Saccharothrix syringae TaxID=103733 RepID=A0A5Q0GZZ8_SACSY|nr:tetratricopeptide repeat protein [Saccharothrix syringae]QFZ19110.1 tetratricopeptide repeat protein [Saccharothrix syringae]